MKLTFNLALKNLYGSGLRTLLNVLVLSLSFVIIILLNSVMDGWNAQAKKDTIAWEYGTGQLQHKNYNPLDSFTILDGHGPIPKNIQGLTPIYVHQAAVFPQGRMMNIHLKGIPTNQEGIILPTHILEQSGTPSPVLIGKRFAESAKLKTGDSVLLRWRDKNGTFDATTITVAGVFDSNVPTVDERQIWMPLETLWAMTGQAGEVTYFIAGQNYQGLTHENWIFKSQKELLSVIEELINTKKASSSFMYILLLAIALLAIFDTQVLSIFRRQREIGTYIALGMTRSKVVSLFTLEGSAYSFLALILASLYGIPLFVYLTKMGIPVAPADQEIGLAIADRIFPVYGVSLVLWTIVLVVLSATVVSYLPARKIAKLNPVLALKGKQQ